ncbi:MAG: hypothetical protein ABJ193_05335, partial [Parasphingorhabdus sp.]
NFKKKCQQVFRRKLQQSDIIMVSHSNGALKEYCTTGVVLEDGSLTYFPNIDDAISQHNENMARR